MKQFYRIEATYKSGRTEIHTKPSLKEAKAMQEQLMELGAIVSVTAVKARA